ncbi:MAG: hypothetical protein WCS03_13670 [Bacteroidota bacterium]
MKKLIILMVLLAFAVNGNGQCKFYTNSGATLITETKCGEYKDITVTMPVPANVSTYDAFTVRVSLSSIDVKAICEFNKNKIQSKLAGKSEISLLLISADGKSSDFSFPDAGITNADLCDNPRSWNMDKITATVTASGGIILSYNAESHWDENKGAIVTVQVPVWDDGELTSEGIITIIQIPLSDGVTDENNKLSIKLANPSNSSYNAYEPGYDYDGGLKIYDNSLVENFAIKILYFDESKHTLDFIKSDLLKTFNNEKTELGWAYLDYFDYNNKLDFQKAAASSDKNTVSLKKKTTNTATANTPIAYETVNIEGKDFFHFVYNQNKHQSAFYPNPSMPAMRVHIYLYYKAPYIVVVSSWITDDLLNKGEETITKAEEILKSTVGSIKIN